MFGPRGLAYDSANTRLFVAQANINRVTVYNVASITDGQNAVNVLGQSSFSANGPANTQAGMSIPIGLAFDSANARFFVAQQTSNRVTVYNVASITDGQNAVNVLGQPDFTTATAANTQAGMNSPQGIAYDPTNQRLFVAQTSNRRVTVFDIAPATTIAGTVYTDEGHTAMATGRTVAVSLNGGPATATGSTDAGGMFTVNTGATTTGGTIIAVYLKGNNEKGATVTLGSGGLSMTGVSLYQNRLLVRSDSGSVALTNAQLATAAKGDSDLSSIYAVTSGNLSLKSGKALTVWAGKTFAPGGNVSVGSGITINGTLSAGTNTITLSGAWLKASGGSFTQGTSTVTLNGTNQTMSGSTTFYNLTKTVTSPTTLTFAAGTTQTIQGTLTLQGAAGNLLSLRSSSTGSQWNIDPQGTRTLSYLDVQDSNNVNATAIITAGNNITDSGNNTNWTFTQSSTTTLASSLNPSSFGSGVTLTATVTAGATGTVTFKDGSTTIGSATLGHSSGSLVVSSLSVGSHSLTAVYGGDSSYLTSTSNTVTQTVSQASTTTSLASSLNPQPFQGECNPLISATFLQFTGE